MELEQLKHFVKVVEHSNFTRAAQEVGLSQPALSRSIVRLEESLGQPVLERQTRHVSLTDAGEMLLPKAKRILALVEDAKAEITDDGETGRVRVSAIPTIAPFYLPTILRKFSKAYPKSQVLVSEETTEQLLKRLDDGEVDIAILAMPIDKKYLEVKVLFEEELLLVLPKDHPLTEKSKIRIEDIEGLPFVLLGETHCLTGNILTFCSQRSIHPVSVERTSQLATVQELVALGHGVSMIPEMARTLDSSPRRVYRSLSGVRPARTILAAWNPYRFRSKLQRAFVDMLARTS